MATTFERGLASQVPAAAPVAQTVTGVVRWVVVPSPSRPRPLYPHPFTVPFANRAREWLVPAATALMPVNALTENGGVFVVVYPGPSRPSLLYPGPHPAFPC